MKMRLSTMAALLLASVSAHADWNADVGVVTQYYFRGLEQTSGPAAQGGLSWTDTSSAFHPYAGVWLSNLDEVHGLGRLESDAYAGVRVRERGWGADFGVMYYYFADSDQPSATDNVEPYLGVSLGPISLRANYSPNYYSTGFDSWYVQAGVSLPVMKSLTLHLHAARTFGEAQREFDDGGYGDYAVSAIYRLPWWDIDLSASYLLTHAPGEKDRFIAGVSKAFAF